MQTIYVRDEETHFHGVCDECLAAESTLYAPKGDPNVAGTLRRSVDVGFRCCRRGHRIRVRRVRVMVSGVGLTEPHKSAGAGFAGAVAGTA
jgi:hypothetical protein